MGLKAWRPDGSVLFDTASRPGRITGRTSHDGPATVTQTVAVPVSAGKSPWLTVFPWGRVFGTAFDNGNGTWTYSLTIEAGATALVCWGDR